MVAATARGAATPSAPRAGELAGGGVPGTLGAVDSVRLVTVGAPAAVSCVFSTDRKVVEVAAEVIPLEIEAEVEEEAVTVKATTMLFCSR